MVSAGVFVDRRSSTEFSVDDDQNFVEESSFFEVRKQSVESGVQGRGQRVLHFLEVIAVRVPGSAGSVAVADVDHRDTRFDQTSSQHAALTELGPPVRVAE